MALSPVAAFAAVPAVVVAATLPALAAGVYLDAELLALREPFERTLAGIAAVSAAHNAAEEAYFAAPADQCSKANGLERAEKIYDRAVDANTEVLHSIIETPARTLEGLIFKAQACGKADFDSELAVSIAEDLIAMAGGLHA